MLNLQIQPCQCTMYYLIKYNSNYSETAGSLWFYSKDEATDFNANIANTNDFKSFKYIMLNYLETQKLIMQMEFLKMQQLLFH